MTVLEKVLTKMQTLPTDQQQQVLRFVEFLTFELGDRQVNQESENLKEGQRKSNFWKGLQKFRLTIQNERVGFTNEDFADLRDRSGGREIIL
jgi:mRNA-degrading endonuclease RelE of RelBE toxin-antitoxin system